MLNKIDFKKQLGLTLTFFILTLALFAIATFGFLSVKLDGSIFLNHVFISLAIAIYVFIMIQFKMNFAFLVFIVGYVFSYATLFYVYTRTSDGFTEAAGLIAWSVINALIVALGIALEVTLKTRHRNKELRQEMKAQEHLEDPNIIDVDLIESTQDETQVNN